MNYTEQVLLPLQQFKSPVTGKDTDTIPDFGTWGTDEVVPEITHAQFILQYAERLLPGACQRYGRENVIRELAEITIPAYEVVPNQAMAIFWSRTVPGSSYEVEIQPGESNSELAAEHGVMAVYRPIMELGIAHAQTRVFGASKYFYSHAVRMGHMVSRFGIEELWTYIKLAKQLLGHGVYDWSIELGEKQWKQLTPIISRYGFRAVMSSYIHPICELGDIPGTKDAKYQFSLFPRIFWKLSPYLLPRMLEYGPNVLVSDLQPIIQFIREMHGKEGFTKGNMRGSTEEKFFLSWGYYLPSIQEIGIEATLSIIRAKWEPQLLPDSSST